jgi:two-component system CheB/CheR fusion protein
MPSENKNAVEKSNLPCCVVGIGSSAGGLEALRSLFGSLQPTKNLSFVVVQHLSPTHRSRLVEIIGNSTNLKVKEAATGIVPKAGYVYITPPNKDIRLAGGKLKLEPPINEVGPKPSVDVFLRSLASENKKDAVGIILSGTGSDGSLGIRAIREAGGVTISQTEKSAKYDGMPKSANHTGAVDLELSPEAIARELSRIDKLGQSESRKRDSNPGEKSAPPDTYLDILKVLEHSTGADFASYKHSTIKRRIERRIHATEMRTAKAYLNLLRSDPLEAQHLLQDILISVTSFFRDTKSFRRLYLHAKENLKNLKGKSELRCWVAACATGEEAYSMAMILSEATKSSKNPIKLQIFATDLDERALSIARRGVYPESAFADFPEAWKERYFQPKQGKLQIKQALRDLVIFAKHNLISDPPFLEIDVLTCRNVMIYFDSKLQDRVFHSLHYALNEGGILFLGKSESVPANNPYFHAVDKTHKIFHRTSRRGIPALPKLKPEAPRDSGLGASVSRTSNSQEELFRALVAAMAPDSVLVDEDAQIKHYYGNSGAYFKPAAGSATLDFRKLVQKELCVELSNLFLHVAKSGHSIKGRIHEITLDGTRKQVQVSVSRLMNAGAKEYLISFHANAMPKQPKATKSKGKKESGGQVARMREELEALREHLQSITEEQDVSNEELQALNEELQSANEELQSSNEELETTNEELQSTNEELTTLNEEINVKSAELVVASQQSLAVQTAIVYPLLMLDRQKRLLSFNPAAKHLFKLSDEEIGNVFWADSNEFDFTLVIKLFDRALRSGTDVSEQIKVRERSFEIKVQLIRSGRREIDGAVVSFVENTQILIALEESKAIRERLSSILENTPAMVVMKDSSGIYLYANRRFYEATGKSQADVIGSTDDEIFGPEMGRLLRDRDFKVANSKTAIQTDEVLALGSSSLVWAASRFPLFDAQGRVQSVCTVALDITERTEQERKLLLFREAISSSHAYLAIFKEGQGGGFQSTFISNKLEEDFSGAIGSEGHSVAEVLETFEAEKPSLLNGLAKALETKDSHKFTLGVKKRDGDQAYIEICSSIVVLGKDQQKYLILYVLDLSTRIKNEQTIAQQQEELTLFGRLSAVAEISAGIAHEINTPLNVITTKTDLLRRLLQKGKMDPAAFLRLADDVDRMAKNISSIVLGLKTFAGSEAESPELVPLAQVIRDSVKICEFRLQRFAIDTTMQLPENPIWVKCFPVQITQIFVNLINNSIDASLDRSNRWIKIQLTATDTHAVVRLVDSGNGIPPELAEKIMTPFFTTKKEQKGTGIGLSLSRTIAHRHGGELVLDPNVRNTAFVLRLPLSTVSKEGTNE